LIRTGIHGVPRGSKIEIVFDQKEVVFKDWLFPVRKSLRNKASHTFYLNEELNKGDHEIPLKLKLGYLASSVELKFPQTFFIKTKVTVNLIDMQQSKLLISNSAKYVKVLANLKYASEQNEIVRNEELGKIGKFRWC
jgi:hypothetical protein